MKKVWYTVLIAFLLVSFAKSDVIVLKNGKAMRIPGTYEVKRNIVVFKDKSGELAQLPLSMVDLEKSREATLAAEKAALEAQKAKAEAGQKKATNNPRNMSMSEIAEEVQKNRDPDEEAPTSFSISGDRLSKYAEANPAPVRSQAPSGSSAASGNAAGSGKGGESLALTPDQYEAKRAEYGDQYKQLNGEIQDLKKRIEEAEASQISLENATAFNDGQLGDTYDAMERAEKQVADLKKELATKEKAMNSLVREAARHDIKGLDRIK